MRNKQRSWIRYFLVAGALLILCSCYPPSSPPLATATQGNVTQSALVGAPEMETEVMEEGSMSALTPLSITVIYDNNPYDKRLKTAWGFSALVEYGGEKILFDTGGDGATLLENMRILMIDPTHIDRVVLSHAHGDHTGGLSGLLDYGARPVVYLLPSFPETFKTQAASKTEVIEVMPGQPITEHMFTTGAMGRNIPEQALVIQTDQGLVVITGCAHPGIVEIVQQARDLFAGRVHLVLGGFHLRDKSTAEIKAILRDFRQLEVELAAPCHCTGEQAIAMFAAEYKENFIQVGVGRVIRFDEIAPKE